MMKLLKIIIICLMMFATQQVIVAQNSNPSALKNSALAILQNKCNTCHAIHNRKKVFTEATMDAHAANIYKQVYIKRRMPKGEKIKLTKDEEVKLLLWLKEAGVVTSK